MTDILNLLKCPLPSDDVYMYNATNNVIDHRAYVDTCRLFGVDPNDRYTVIQIIHLTSNDLGTAAYYGGGQEVLGKDNDAYKLNVWGLILNRRIWVLGGLTINVVIY